MPNGIRLYKKLIGHQNFITRFCWSPDGNYICSSSLDNTIRLWRVDTGRATSEPLKLPGAVWKVAWVGSHLNPLNISVIAVAYQGPEIFFFDATDLTHIERLDPLLDENLGTALYSLAWSNDGMYLAAAGFDQIIRIWGYSPADGWTVHTRLPHSHTAGVNTLAWSSREYHRYLVSGSADGTVRLWDIINKIEVPSCQFTRDVGVNSVAWFPEGSSQGGSFVSANNSGLILVHSSINGKTIKSIEGHSAAVRRVDVSSDGKLMASKAADGTVRLWDTETWKELAVIDEPGPQNPNDWHTGMAFHPSEPLLASLDDSDTSIRIWLLDYRLLRQKLRLVVLPGQQVGSLPINYASAKIVMVGDSGVGKTGLGWRLAHGEFKEHASTHGQQFWMLDQMYRVLADGTQCEAILWDLAGQPDYRIIHAFFLDDADLILLVFDPTHEKRPLHDVEFWLKQLEVRKEIHGISNNPSEHKKTPPVILVAARSDRGMARLTDEEIIDYCNQRGLSGYICTSAFNGEGIHELEQKMQDLISWDKQPGIVTNESFQRIRSCILI